MNKIKIPKIRRGHFGGPSTDERIMLRWIMKK